MLVFVGDQLDVPLQVRTDTDASVQTLLVKTCALFVFCFWGQPERVRRTLAEHEGQQAQARTPRLDEDSELVALTAGAGSKKKSRSWRKHSKAPPAPGPDASPEQLARAQAKAEGWGSSSSDASDSDISCFSHTSEASSDHEEPGDILARIEALVEAGPPRPVARESRTPGPASAGPDEFARDRKRRRRLWLELHCDDARRLPTTDPALVSDPEAPAQPEASPRAPRSSEALAVLPPVSAQPSAAPRVLGGLGSVMRGVMGEANAKMGPECRTEAGLFRSE